MRRKDLWFYLVQFSSWCILQDQIDTGCRHRNMHKDAKYWGAYTRTRERRGEERRGEEGRGEERRGEREVSWRELEAKIPITKMKHKNTNVILMMMICRETMKYSNSNHRIKNNHLIFSAYLKWDWFSISRRNWCSTSCFWSWLLNKTYMHTNNIMLQLSHNKGLQLVFIRTFQREDLLWLFYFIFHV